MPAIKPRHIPPLGYTGRVPKLVVRHPHYQNHNTLVKLPALDEDNTVDYNAALIVCGIICDNSWSTGWFAWSKDGSNACEQGLLLTADRPVYSELQQPVSPFARSILFSQPVGHEGP
jgi:hypothetical protein